MFVYIKIIGGDHLSEGKNVKINISPMESVATLKGIYSNTGLCPNPTSISLRYKGAVLQDEKLLKEYDITEGSQIMHFTYNMPSYSSIDYPNLSLSLKQKARNEGDYFHAGYSPDQNSTWDQTWERGDEWKDYPPNIIKEEENTLITTEKPKIQQQRPGRMLIRTYICLIDNCRFEIYQKMEGRWNGTATVLGSDLTDQGSVSSVIQTFNTKGYWNERRSLTHPDGLCNVSELKLIPISSGCLKVEIIGDKRYLNYNVVLREIENDIMILSYINKINHLPLMIETITLIDDFNRIRTQQQFDTKGNLTKISVLNERRVIDEISGAVSKVIPSDII